MKTFKFWKDMILQEMLVCWGGSMVIKNIFEGPTAMLVAKILMLISFLLVLPCMLLANKYAMEGDKKFLPKHLLLSVLVFVTSLIFFVFIHIWLN